MSEQQRPMTNAEKFRNLTGGSPESGDDTEVDLWEGSYSPKAMTGAWLGAALISIAVIVVMFITPLRDWSIAWWIVLVGLVIYWVYLLGLLLYRKFSMYYRVTTQRLLHREGIFIRQMDRIDLIDVDDVRYHQGPIQAMLGVGNITVKSSDISHPILKLYGIQNIREVADIIDNARRAERRKRGLHTIVSGHGS